jgi:hypothetical protein
MNEKSKDDEAIFDLQVYEWEIEQVSLHACVCACVRAHTQQAHMGGNKFFFYSDLLTTVQKTVIVK